MQININKEKFLDIEDGFTRLKSNENDVSALRKISDALSSIMKKSIKVETISPTNPNREYFIMSVYPEESTIMKIVDAIINEEKDAILAKIWNDSSSWTIEIDTRILSNKFNMSEKELTALILHEIGHIVLKHTTQCEKNEQEANFFASQIFALYLFNFIPLGESPVPILYLDCK